MSEVSKPADAERGELPTPKQHEGTQCEGTKPPCSNTYWDNRRPGIDVGVVAGEPLFSWLDHYDSGTG